MKANHRIDKSLVIWLLTGCFLVALMVIVGGITRLTESGLSIVNWNLIMGTLPPLNEHQWQEVFELYRQSPEFQKVNAHFEMEDFKSIFWWEYIHRLLGRILGLVFLIPFVYFLYKKKVTGSLKTKLWIIFLLGAFQGFLGWFMVKSGLVDRPSVSHYRLAAHLTTALFLYAYILWVALQVMIPRQAARSAGAGKLKKWTVALLSILTLQIIYGAFVAGLNAGFIVNTFPLMTGAVVHPSIGRALGDMGLSALTEHILTVQFIHRYLGKLLVVLGFWVWWKYWKTDVSGPVKVALNWTALVFAGQFLLGVFTLLFLVPVWMGVLHQFGAIVLLTVLVYMLFRVKQETVASAGE